MNKKKKLINMKILITGASRGLGAACAAKLAKMENSEIFLISRNKAALENLRNTINHEKTASEIHLFDTDLEKEENIKALIKKIGEKTDRLDIIINNAGNLIKKDFSEISLDEINRVFSVNYTAPALIIREGLPLLQKAENPHCKGQYQKYRITKTNQ